MNSFERKIVGRSELSIAAGSLARPLVLTNGVFDILHRGHVSYLSRARALGSALIVAINSDDSVRRLGKGAGRPVNTEADRAAILAALECVTLVTIFEESVPLLVLDLARPDIYVKGGDYVIDSLPETERVRIWGGRAVAIPFEYERSTTSLIQRVRTSHG